MTSYHEWSLREVDVVSETLLNITDGVLDSMHTHINLFENLQSLSSWSFEYCDIQRSIQHQDSFVLSDKILLCMLEFNDMMSIDCKDLWPRMSMDYATTLILWL